MDAVSGPPVKRPKLVWVVFLFYLFSVAYTALSFFLIFSGAISVTAEQAAYFRNLSVFDWATTALTSTLNLVAAVSYSCSGRSPFIFLLPLWCLGSCKPWCTQLLLILLRRSAVPALLAS